MKGLLVAGGLSLLALHALACLPMSLTGSRGLNAEGVIPFAGPILNVTSGRASDFLSMGLAFMVANFVGQVVGLGMTIIGLAMPERPSAPRASLRLSGAALGRCSGLRCLVPSDDEVFSMGRRVCWTVLIGWATVALGQETPLLPLPLPTGQCSNGLGCSAGEVCADGQCLASCRTAKDCSLGSVCSGYVLMPDGRWSLGACRSGTNGSLCTGEGQCARGFVCAFTDDVTVGSCEDKATAAKRGRFEYGVPKGVRIVTAPEPERFKGGLVPEGFHVEKQPIVALIVGGIVATSVAYGLTAVVAYFGRDPNWAIPVYGPLYGITVLPSPPRDLSGVLVMMGDGLAAILYVVDSIVQVGGIVAAVIGFVAGREVLVPNKPKLSLVPGAAGAPLGASLVGKF